VGRQGPPTVVTACDLIGTDGDEGNGIGDDLVPDGLLSDLYHSRLIITAEYIGPDRRTLDRRQAREHRRLSRGQERRAQPRRHEDRNDAMAGATRWWRIR
jgi:hypothetical protein